MSGDTVGVKERTVGEVIEVGRAAAESERQGR
jgi:hypothetical protein